MALAEPIKLRISPEKHAQYEDEAARRGKPLGTYLRERLEAGDSVRDELAAMRRELASLHHAVEDLAAAGQRPADGDGQGATAVQIETLLLLRAIAGPDRMTTIRGELKRLGVQTWTPEEAQIG
ncbi:MULTISPECIES: mobilization protein [Pseudomonadota]|uniref:Mobilisation protein n=1 Tax=Bordetella parapertussis (strain Bpp5) TaxID=1208660 RepID=K0MBT4_BORPB|nr:MULTISPECIES: mobilization protein [Pseudomonadota]EEZ3210521.1 mobilization protein [Escherichia coli]CCJ51901.1 mobilisation protein [Bordetella parapertussis Bpp5]